MSELPIRRDGHNRILPDFKQSSITAPQHDIDVRIARIAYGNLDRTLKWLGASGQGQGSRIRVVAYVRRMAVHVNRQLQKSCFYTLSTRQREVLLDWLDEDTRKRLMKPGMPPMPECLKPENLPKKPPTRRNFNGNG